ncbi:MAG: response regulator [Marinilabiliaceae bacterium]|nr:response regulator [Marinilabiliaceae bacterium]
MRKVLVVEDDKFISAIFTMFLRELGHDLVDICTTGQEAVNKSHQVRPDVVLMDIHLEGDMDGIQTAEQLRRELDIPVIYISSDTSSHVIKRAIVSNSYGFLVKPINKKELGIAIDLAYYKHRVDQEQRERERGYRQFISEAPMPLMIVQDERIQYLNNLALELYKTHYIEDVLTTPYLHFIEEESKALVESALHEFEEHGHGFGNLQVAMKDVHGQSFYVLISGSCVVFNKKKSLQITLIDQSGYIYCQKKDNVIKKVLENKGVSYLITDERLKVKEIINSTLLKGVKKNGKPAPAEEIIFKDVDTKEELIYRLFCNGLDEGLFAGHAIKDAAGKTREIVFFPAE